MGRAGPTPSGSLPGPGRGRSGMRGTGSLLPGLGQGGRGQGGRGSSGGLVTAVLAVPSGLCALAVTLTLFFSPSRAAGLELGARRVPWPHTGLAGCWLWGCGAWALGLRCGGTWCPARRYLLGVSV